MSTCLGMKNMTWGGGSGKGRVINWISVYCIINHISLWHGSCPNLPSAKEWVWNMMPISLVELIQVVMAFLGLSDNTFSIKMATAISGMHMYRKCLMFF